MVVSQENHQFKVNFIVFNFVIVLRNTAYSELSVTFKVQNDHQRLSRQL